MKLNNKYFLLRHGQTIYQKNSTRVNYPADADFTLSITEEGREMIKTAAESLKKENINMIFASPALRTKQSAEIAGKILSIEKISYDDRLLDIKIGEFASKTYEEYENFFSNKMERFVKRPKDGENWNDIIARLKQPALMRSGRFCSSFLIRSVSASLKTTRPSSTHPGRPGIHSCLSIRHLSSL